MRKLQAYVLSESPEEPISAYAPKRIPKMVLIPNPEIVGEIPSEILLRNQDPQTKSQYRLAGTETEPFSWWVMDPDTRLVPFNIEHSNVIPPEIVKYLNLQGGDKLELIINDLERRVAISGINGQPAKKVPDISQISEDYPHRPLNIDRWGFFGLRVMSSLAPLGLGFCGYLIAPGKSGKTSLTLELWESLLRLSTIMPNLFVMGLSIGERPKDSTLYSVTKQSVPHNPDHAEFYSAPVGKVAMAGQWRTFEYFIARARALARYYDVVAVIDSLHRAAAADSFRIGRTDEENSGGMISGGIYTGSMIKTTEMVSLTGDYGQTSLSIFNVLLGNYKQQRQNGSALSRISEETGDNIPDVVWSLVVNPLIEEFPKVDVPLTAARRMWQFSNPQQLDENKRLLAESWKDEARAPDACRSIQINARKHPIPAWIENPPPQPLIPFHLLNH